MIKISKKNNKQTNKKKQKNKSCVYTQQIFFMLASFILIIQLIKVAQVWP